MNKFQNAFSKGKAYIGFITCGDPDLATTRQAVLAAAENGADIIIGAHPHVPQDFGTVTERQIPVAYSIGNCISNMSAANTQLGLMAQIRLTRKLNGDIEMLPVRFTYIWCSRPGGFTTSYTVIPVKEYLGKRDKWIGGWEYDKMVTTYERVRSIIGIEDN